jgi:hypothetical protein
MNDGMHDVKTKFHSYVSFGTTPFDTTPDADDDEGYIDIRTARLDGDFTLEDLKSIVKMMELSPEVK